MTTIAPKAEELDKLLSSLATTREVPLTLAGTKVVTTIGDLHAVLRTMPRAIAPAKRGSHGKSNNQYSPGFKQQVIDALPYHNSIAACARYFGISSRTLHRWINTP